MLVKCFLSLALTTSVLVGDFAHAQSSTTKKTTTTTKRATKETKAQAEARLKAEAEAKAKAEADAKAKAEAEAKAKAEEAAKNETALDKFRKYVSVGYHGEYLLRRRDATSDKEDEYKIQDFYIMHNPSVSVTPFTNWRFRASSEFKYSDRGAKYGSYLSGHYRSLFSLTRENVFTEKDHGVRMDLGVAYRLFDNESSANAHGNYRLTSNFRKSFGDKLSTGVFAQYLYNAPDTRGKTRATTWKHSLEIIPSFTYQITDKLSYFFNDDFIINTPLKDGQHHEISMTHEMNIMFLSYQFTEKHGGYFQYKWYFTEQAPFQKASNDFEEHYVYIGHVYNITPKMSWTSEIGTTVIAAKDKRDGFAKEAGRPEIYFYFDWRL